MNNKKKRIPPKKISSEEQFRKKLLDKAKILGCEQDVSTIFKKYDDLLKNCTNNKERQQISVLGIVELHKYFGCIGSLEINGVEVIPALPIGNTKN